MKGTAAAVVRGSDSEYAKRPEDWSLEDWLPALQRSHGLIDEAPNTGCRERGPLVHHLVQWRSDFRATGETGSQPRERTGNTRIEAGECAAQAGVEP